jgi:hypothetical protein
MGCRLSAETAAAAPRCASRLHVCDLEALAALGREARRVALRGFNSIDLAAARPLGDARYAHDFQAAGIAWQYRWGGGF